MVITCLFNALLQSCDWSGSVNRFQFCSVLNDRHTFQGVLVLIVSQIQNATSVVYLICFKTNLHPACQISISALMNGVNALKAMNAVTGYLNFN